MFDTLLLFFLFLLSTVMTYFVKEIAIKKSLVDIPNHRSSHTTPTPHGGGIAIAVTWFIGITYLYFTQNINVNLYYALMIGIVISVVSYLDDLYELSAKLRIVTQSVVAIFGLYLLGGLEKIDLVFFSIENQILTNLFAFLMIVWFINLYNFLDGIDGYAGTEAVFLGIAGYILFGDGYFLVLVFSVLGFLIWNWHKAKIFMGDVGSTLLGYNVAIFAIYYQNPSFHENNSETSLLVWFILFGLFCFDATFTLFRRYKNKENLSQPHKKHAYQRLNQSGFTHDKIVKLSLLVNIGLFAMVYLFHNAMIAFFVAFIYLYAVMKYVDTKKAFE